LLEATFLGFRRLTRLLRIVVEVIWNVARM